MMWLVTLAGCFSDPLTTETTFAGRLTDAEGEPVEGFLVVSMEAQARTAEDGTFDLRITPDNRLVHFTEGDTWFRQIVQPEHQGTVVPMTVPKTIERTLWCPEVDCALTLTWDFGTGFEGQVSPKCAPGERIELAQAPEGKPVAQCLEGKGSEQTKVPVVVSEFGPELRVSQRRLALNITVQGDVSSKDCAVRVGERIAPPVPESVGHWEVEVLGPAQVSARCRGIPTAPVLVDPTETTEVTVAWVEQTPTLALTKLAPWAHELVLASEGADPGWSMRLLPDDQGTVVLPPLVRGNYRLMVRAADRDVPLVSPPPSEAAPGVATFGPVTDRTQVGRLVVDTKLAAGPVQVSVAP